MDASDRRNLLHGPLAQGLEYCEEIFRSTRRNAASTWAEHIETGVVPWIRAQSTETLVAALRAADSYELARTITPYAPVLDTELIEERIRRKPEAAGWLIERPDGVPKAAGNALWKVSSTLPSGWGPSNWSARSWDRSFHTATGISRPRASC